MLLVAANGLVEASHHFAIPDSAHFDRIFKYVGAELDGLLAAKGAW